MAGAIGKKRPKYLNLFEIRLPLAGFVSILHRVSGAGLFLLLPFLVYLLQLSLGPEEAQAEFEAILAQPLVRLLLLGALWAYIHHFCAGIRFLLLDLHMGSDRQASRRSAVAVLAVSLMLTALIGAKLLC